MYSLLLTVIAQAYGEGRYGENAYSSGESLTNTGTAIVIVLTVAAALIFIALLVRFWRKKK